MTRKPRALSTHRTEPATVAWSSDPAAADHAAPAARALGLDALRGLAMVWMTAFHFCFDLNHFRLIAPQDFYRDPFWTLQRTAIVSLFLFCAGAGQGLAQAQGLRWPRFWRRWGLVAGCALLVSAGSWWMFPRSWISFGVLHGMAVMLVLTRLLLSARLPVTVLTALALVCLLLPWLVADAWFDSRWTNWIGLVTKKPITEDYVPLLPWLGMMLIGALAAMAWSSRRGVAPGSEGGAAGAAPRPLRALAGLGRWSLSYYMLHQPVLIGTLMAWQALHGRA